MEKDMKHKLFAGFRGLMVRIPPLLSELGARRSERGARANAERLSDEERRVHHHVVLKMVPAKAPITAEMIASDLAMDNERVKAIIDKLESLKTFLYRSDGRGIDWAYPLSLEDTGMRMSAASGERFFAA